MGSFPKVWRFSTFLSRLVILQQIFTKIYRMKSSPVALAVFCDSERDASSAGDGNALFVRQGSSHQSWDFGVAILALSASIHSRLTKTQATIVGSAQREHLKDISTYFMFKKIV